MTASRIGILVAFVLVLGVPLALRPRTVADGGVADARRLVVVTPHVSQIRKEFGRAFDAWHEREYGQRVIVDFRYPGGTSVIIRQLEAQFAAAAKNGMIDPETLDCPDGTIGFDLMFGGGSYDHGKLKDGVTVRVRGTESPVTVPMSVPAGFSQERLDAWFGENRIGSGKLYDEEQYWIGNALSSFGIVFNRDVLDRMAIDEPASFEDLADPRLAGLIALADPRQSSSITTTFDSILGNYGWDKGWRVLREMAANTRYFTSSSTKPPIDVSAGEAAMGLAIDFYGRAQAQAVARPGEEPHETRVGYTNPNAVYVDADPISILRGGPDPELARRFVEFSMVEEGQALWQFKARRGGGASNPTGPDGKAMGPEEYELRRMPARRVMYEEPYYSAFVDEVRPFEVASEVRNPGWRAGIMMMMGAFSIDIHDKQRRAWVVLNEARREAGFPPDVLARMESLFYAFPDHVMPDGSRLAFVEENYRTIRNSWRDPDHPDWQARCKVDYTEAFSANYREILRLGRAASGGR